MRHHDVPQARILEPPSIPLARQTNRSHGLARPRSGCKDRARCPPPHADIRTDRDAGRAARARDRPGPRRRRAVRQVRRHRRRAGEAVTIRCHQPPLRLPLLDTAGDIGLADDDLGRQLDRAVELLLDAFGGSRGLGAVVTSVGRDAGGREGLMIYAVGDVGSAGWRVSRPRPWTG